VTELRDLWQLSLVALSEGLREGTIEAERLLDQCLARIARIDPALNTMVALDEPGARQQAHASALRLRAGNRRSAIDGIPLTIKDNLLVRDLPAVWGSRGYIDYVPDHDELPVERLRAAGAVLVGKTNVPELTLEGYTSNQIFGTTTNPWDTRLTPGGSSGAAAAGVAAGLVPAAIGTDGGGSIRRPASHTGLVGFKPSTGRYARADGFPGLLFDFDVVAILTRSVADAKLLDGVLAGPDPRDRRSLLMPSPPRHDPARLRILYVPRFGDSPLDPEVEAATDAAAQALADRGHRLETGPIPFDRVEADDIWRIVSRCGVACLFQRQGPEFAKVAGPFVAGLDREGREISSAAYVATIERTDAFRRYILALFERYDLVYTPSAAALPWPADSPYPTEIAGRPAGPRGHAVYTGWVNTCGHPAINLPLAFSHAGLPIGGQFVGAFGTDAELLDIAAAFEAVLKPETRWPPIATNA
jgi:aspartyl-tRNA(Asn)/glutamyl-tRNA(Gln) amidotransferase subunit A